MVQVNSKKSISGNLIYLIIATLILSAGLNVILLSGYLDNGKNSVLDKRYENAKLDGRVLDLIDDRPLRAEIDFYPPMDVDEFSVFAKNHGLKPVIFGYNSANKKENDEQLIKKYNLKEGGLYH